MGKAISVHTTEDLTRHEAVTKLKAQIQSQLMSLTTHIEEDNYDEVLHELIERQTNFMDPVSVNHAIQSENFDLLPNRNTSLNGIRKILKILSILNLILPYSFWKFWLEPKITEIEFRSTFRFAVCLVLAPIFWGINVGLMITYFGYEIGLSYALVSFLIFLLTVKL